jgi:maltose alpha-D-glucosyltransferase / alpha-amylase
MDLNCFFSIFLALLFSFTPTLSASPSLHCLKLCLQNIPPSELNLKENFTPLVRQNLRKNIRLIFQTEDPIKIEEHEKSILEKVRDSIRRRPKIYLQEDRQSLQPKRKGSAGDTEYQFYVDQFGVKGEKMDGTFQEATEMLDYLQDLGIDTVYALPFLKSPLKDGGFDVSDFRAVSEERGGMLTYKAFIGEAMKHGMKVKMDIILNHVSEEHEWFQKLLKGDLRFKDYFISREEPPIILGRYTDKRGQIVRYLEKNQDGKEVEIERRLIFPDISSSHYRKIEVPAGPGKTKSLWIYHTFFPFQLDLNYANPRVMMEALDIVSYWANKGVDIFRLDSIPFLDKTAENHPRTHAIIELLSTYLKHIAPKSSLIVEANQKPKDILKYLGTSQKVINNFLGETIKGTSEASSAYHFGEIPFWASLLTGDKKYIQKTIQEFSELPLPKEATWITFLRVHDELTLEMVNPEIRNIINHALLRTGHEKGLPFRDGFGVGGRLASFLDHQPDRIKMAYSILLGRPGQPVIYYGDEIATENNLNNMVEAGKKRKTFMDQHKIPYREPEGKAKVFFQNNNLPPHLPLDTRDANRGPIPQSMFLAAQDPRNQSVGATVYRGIKKMISARKLHPAVSRGKLKILRSNQPDVLTYQMIHSDENLLMVNNLSNKPSLLAVQMDFIPNKLLNSGDLIDAITGSSIPYTLNGKKLTLSVGSYDTLWLILP